jgi:hypothetical protein
MVVFPVSLNPTVPSAMCNRIRISRRVLTMCPFTHECRHGANRNDNGLALVPDHPHARQMQLVVPKTLQFINAKPRVKRRRER